MYYLALDVCLALQEACSENGVQYFFKLLTKTQAVTTGAPAAGAGGDSAPQLPLAQFFALALQRHATPAGAPTTQSRHEEHQYLDIVRDILTSGMFPRTLCVRMSQNNLFVCRCEAWRPHRNWYVEQVWSDNALQPAE